MGNRVRALIFVLHSLLCPLLVGLTLPPAPQEGGLDPVNSISVEGFTQKTVVTSPEVALHSSTSQNTINYNRFYMYDVVLLHSVHSNASIIPF